MSALYATILVMVVTNQRILLAADSRKTYLDEKGIHKTDTIDKIYETNDCYYAVCGFHEEVKGFSIHRLLHNYLAKLADFRDAISQITHSLAVELKSYFSSLKTNSPAIFQHLRSVGGSAGEVFLIKNYQYIPTAYILEYHILDTKDLKVTVTSRSITISAIPTNTTCFWRAIGNTGYLPSSFQEKDWALQPEIIAHKVIEEGCKRTPTFVSPPINIVELTPSGVRWIEKTATAPNRIGI